MEVFSNNDVGYRKWLSENRDGWVVNTGRSPSPDYMILHRADCYSGILAFQHQNPTKDYTKWCSTDRLELRREVPLKAGGGRVTEKCSCHNQP